MSETRFAVTDVRAKKEEKEISDMCTRAQKVITSNPYYVKKLLDQTVMRARALVIKFQGADKTLLEAAMFHLACGARDLDLTAIQ